MRTIALVLLLSVTVSGCVAVVAGAGAAATYVWVRGNLETTFQYPLNRVEAATRAAVEALDLVAIDSAVDGLKGEISARMASGSRVRIRLRALDLESTEVAVRVGTFGDKAASEQIMRHIDRQLSGE